MKSWLIRCALGLIALASHAEAAKPIACVAPQARTTYKPESRCANLEVDGTIRTYRIYAPRAKARVPLPVLIALHAGGGSGSALEATTIGQFNRIADERGAIVLYPDGIDRSWNDVGAAGVPQPADDVVFLKSLLEVINQQNPIDRGRVYVTGFSNGGLLAYRLACDATDWVAAVAVVAANLPVDLARQCRGSRVPPIAIFDGTDDPVMPWIGGPMKSLWKREGEVLSAQESSEQFMRRGDCALPITHSPRDKIPEDGTSIIRHVARECRDGAEVRLYEILGGGHTWPGGQLQATKHSVGRLSREMNASEEIWSFVSRYSIK